MPRVTYRADIGFTFQMDDTLPTEVAETITVRVNEMLAALERKDDVRIVLLDRLEVTEQK